MRLTRLSSGADLRIREKAAPASRALAAALRLAGIRTQDATYRASCVRAGADAPSRSDDASREPPTAGPATEKERAEGRIP